MLSCTGSNLHSNDESIQASHEADPSNKASTLTGEIVEPHI